MVQILIFLSLFASCLAIVRAFIDRRRSANEIILLQEQLVHVKQTLKKRGELAGEIAHEIKNPLTAILCSAETLDLLLKESLTKEHRNSLSYIRDYGDQLLRLVSDFLELTRLEFGAAEPAPERVEISPIIDSVVGLLTATAMRKKITIKTTITDPSLAAHSDPKHLRQILFNLLHNALKFTPEEGEVQIIVRSLFPKKEISIGVLDTGKGIPPLELESLFDAYKRYEGNQPHHGIGVGIGLAVCKALIEKEHGNLTVESKVGVGSCFEFTLPHAEVSEEATTAPQVYPRYDKPLEGQTVLLVEGHPGAKVAIQKLIEAWGGMVSTVSEATDAVKAVSEKHYDSVMVDPNDTNSTLGEFSTNDLVKMIRTAALDGETRIVLAAPKPNIQETEEGCVADKYIQKPLTGKAILESLVKSAKYSIH